MVRPNTTHFAFRQLAAGLVGAACVAGAPAQPVGDCNNNGVPDDIDILKGLSTDINQNGTPDECEGIGVEFLQTSWPDRVGGFTERFSDIGVMGVTIPEPLEDQPVFLNAVINGQWLVRNHPLIQIDAPGDIETYWVHLPIAQGQTGVQIPFVDGFVTLDPQPRPLADFPFGPPSFFPVQETIYEPGTVYVGGPPADVLEAPRPGPGTAIDNDPMPAAVKMEVRRRDVKGVNEGVDECAPGASARSLDWMNRLYCLKFPATCDTPQELHDKLKDAQHMKTNMCTDGMGNVIRGTLDNKLIAGLIKCIMDKAVPGGMLEKCLMVVDRIGADTPQTVFDELGKGKDIIGLMCWRDPADLSRTTGGHAITVVGAQKCGDMITIYYRDDVHGGDDQGDGDADANNNKSAKLVPIDTDGDGVNDGWELRGLGRNTWDGFVAICPTRLKQIQAATKWLTGDGTPTGIEGIRARLQRLADGETLTPEELEELKQWARNLRDIACYLLNQINADPGAFGDEAKMAAEALKMAAVEIELNICDIVDFGPNPDSIANAIGAADDAIENRIVVIADSVDCNLNGIDDSVDIADGVLTDADNDGIPDICDTPDRLCADTNLDGLVTPADFNAWVLAFNNNDPIADANQDGLVNPADFNAWILAFNQGPAGPVCDP